MEALSSDEQYSGKVNFLMLNLQGLDDAKAYARSHGIQVCPHGQAQVPPSYGVRYIPHKVLIGKDGLVINNYEGFDWSSIDKALAAPPPPVGEVAEAGVSVSDDSAEQIARAFAQFDLNGDGVIDHHELGQVLRKLEPTRWTDDRLRRVFRAADADRDGRLDYAEFSSWVCKADLGSLRRSLGLAKYGMDGGLGVCDRHCGRRPFRHFKTCCTHCSGPDGPHSRDCEQRARRAPGRRKASASSGRPTRSPRAAEEPSLALTSILGDTLVRSDQTKVSCAGALKSRLLIGILFTAVW